MISVIFQRMEAQAVSMFADHSGMKFKIPWNVPISSPILELWIMNSMKKQADWSDQSSCKENFTINQDYRAIIITFLLILINILND